MPAAKVPSRLNSAMPRARVQAKTMIAAIAERDDDWISGGISWIASLIETLLKPQLRHSPMVTITASASSGRDDGAGGTALRLNPTHHRSRQCEQMPAISISGLFGENPAARDDALSASAAAAPAASPTAPQLSQMRKTTRSSPA